VLWIALHLPLLSLESFAATLPRADAVLGAGAGADVATEPPLALMDARQILSANAAAHALGIRPGLKRATALALAPQLTLGQADRARDAQALIAVAHAALEFTPAVSIPLRDASAGARGAVAVTAPTPDTVLLEVQASLRYFGGLATLLRQLQNALGPLGHRLHIVSARTALGAALLARVHSRLDCADLAATRRALATAPVWLIGPGRAHWEALQGMGLRTLADLTALPRGGLARRFGEAVLSELDRAMGERPDPREPLVLAPTFESRLELFARADTTEQLLHGAGLLLARLVAWLSAQHAFVRRFTLEMQHEKYARRAEPVAGCTRLEIALAEPSRDSAHLLVLLRERLAQLQLPAPTLELRLQAADIARRAPPNAELFPTPQTEQDGLTRLIERLQARLGPEQVQRLRPCDDHRPERATATSAADAQMRAVRPVKNVRATQARRVAPALSIVQGDPHCAAIDTPLPVPLAERDNAPVLDRQRLQLVSGPERIEAGWWDSALAERDYFIAQLPGGALVWIYRARIPEQGEGWFLQGRFG
jgi:protein ImuB